MIDHIVLATDFSPAGISAFHHALALAVRHRARLDMLHVHALDVAKDFARFPRVRSTLAGWQLIPEGLPKEQLVSHTGVQINKIEIRDVDPVEGLTRHLNDNPPQLLVMATHARGALGRLLKGSVSAEVAQETRIPTLLIGSETQGFIDEATGAITLNRVLVPVDHTPAPSQAVTHIAEMLSSFSPQFDLIHAGAEPPVVKSSGGATMKVRTVSGDALERIVEQAATADLIAMPTEGRHSLFDMLLGSTVERVLHESPCPVLAIPVPLR